MEIIYRLLGPDESKAYRNIRLESLKEFPDSFSAKYEETSKIEKLSIETDIENQTLNRFVFAAFKNNEIIGICTCIKNENGIGNIHQMYIRKNYQGQNIGLYLLRNIIKEARNRFGELDISLEVSNNNLAAINLYKKAGFKKEESLEENNTSVMTIRNI